MTKKVALFFVLHLFVVTVFSQNKADRNGNLIGYISKSDLLKGKFKKWFEKEYTAYIPKTKFVKRISKNLDGITVLAFAGTWCHDSKRVLPRFYKIMELAKFDVTKKFKIIGINRGKKTPDNLQKGYNIKRTPTLIFYKNGEEIARFVEHSVATLEKDIFKIVAAKDYKHSYQK